MKKAFCQLVHNLFCVYEKAVFSGNGLSPLLGTYRSVSFYYYLLGFYFCRYLQNFICYIFSLLGHNMVQNCKTYTITDTFSFCITIACFPVTQCTVLDHLLGYVSECKLFACTSGAFTAIRTRATLLIQSPLKIFVK